jgi:hypothetical protein
VRVVVVVVVRVWEGEKVEECKINKLRKEEERRLTR